MSRQISTLNAIHSTIAILTIAIIAIAIHLFTYDFEASEPRPQYALGQKAVKAPQARVMEGAGASAVLPK